MKNTLKTLALASAFAIASLSAMVQHSEAYPGEIVGVGCSSGGSNCQIDWGGGLTWYFSLDWIMVEM